MPRKLEDFIRPRGSKPNLTAKAKNGVGEITIFDDIGPTWMGLIGAKGFKQELDSLGDVKEIVVLVNSPGGDVFEGLSIYNMLKNHPARITTEVVGLAASIASVIAQAGDVRRVAENAALMIHRAWSFSIGFEEDHIAAAELVRNASNQSAKLYAARTGKAEEQILEWMKAETWIFSDTVSEMGFADEITPNKAAAAKFDPSAYGYDRAPEDRLQSLFAEFELRLAAEKAKVGGMTRAEARRLFPKKSETSA